MTIYMTNGTENLRHLSNSIHRNLRQQRIEISPSKTVGSDDLFDYPIEIVRAAEMLRDYKGERRQE